MLSTDDKIAYLKENVMFKDSPINELRSIADIAQVSSFTDGQRIFNVGDVGDAIYFIAKGRVRVHKNEQDITSLEVGECVGEMAVLDAGKRSASVSSIGDSLLLRLDRDDFHRVMQKDINLMQKILTIVVGKLRDQTDRDVEVKIENARIERDLEFAREMQMAIMPTKDLTVKSNDGILLNVSGYCNPAAKVGGDYYDYFKLPDDKLGVVIGDVKGHGFHAGLIVSMVKSCLHMQLKNDHSLPCVMTAMNEIVHVYGYSLKNMYMTFCYMLFDLKNRTTAFCIAGHHYPRHYLAGENRIADINLEFGNSWLGLYETDKYDTSPPKYWNKGDVFVLFSDGITEAENNHQEQFGMERLEKLIIENAHLTPKEIKENILQNHKEFCGDVQQADDITLVVIKVE